FSWRPATSTTGAASTFSGCRARTASASYGIRSAAFARFPKGTIMFLPLHDGVPLQHIRTPFATRSLLVACCLIYLLTFHVPPGPDAAVAGFGMIPAVLFGTEVLPAGYPFVPEPLTLVTNIFLHGSLVHL